MPLILCLETSYKICSVALIRSGELFVAESKVEQNHAESLSSLIEQCLDKAGISIDKLDAVALSNGPGSYTGLRIGASTAKGICFALNIPLIPVDTLKSLAEAFLAREPEWQGLIWPMTDARRMEVYHAVFDAELNQLSKPENAIWGEAGFNPFPERKDVVICGDGSDKLKDVLNLPYRSIHPHAVHLCKAAEDAFSRAEFADVDTYQPFYLKQANITTASLQ